ncbi:hypothetical protein EXIGLDRAFT_761185 [Exidia glandulosa HHB12029]|uniref:Uncharacterized protein n=1 Tax=Exidia glandulosa HHB12029 TaxID=1314781 RepID=A0A165NKX8_EXIGL|nr:hypothetical protein EXIGLDRAFT_761185 [Exidia glandulosa HHB12029]
MDFHLDTSWCPVCDCAVDPQRLTVVLNDDGDQERVVPDGDPYRQPKHDNAHRQPGAHGLVHGTGRVKPGGGLRPLETRGAAKQPRNGDTTPPAPPSSPASKLQTRPKLRSVISQDQTPLYCSEACQLEDARRANQYPVSPTLSNKVPQSPSALSVSSYPYFHKSAPASSSSAQSHAARSTRSEPAPPPPKRAVETIVGFTPIHQTEQRHKPKLEDFRYGTMMITKKIEEALLQPKLPPPRSPAAVEVNPFESRVPPGWRHTDTEWRRIVYGDGFGVPAARPQLPSRNNSMPATVTESQALPSRSVPDELGPFDRALPTRNSVPTLSGFEQLYQKYNLSFARQRGQSSENLSPTSRRFSVSTVSSSVTHSSSGSEPQVSSPRRSTYSTADSDSEDEDLDGEATLGFGFGGPRREYPSLKRLSLPGSTTSLASVQRRTDPLTRMLDEKAKTERLQEREARRVAQLESDVQARKIGAAAHEDDLDEWKRAVRQHGPIMGRRTMSSDDTTKKTHSWSYETLPPHIPLYPMPGYDQRTRRVKKTVRNDITGTVEEHEVEASPQERKRLFLFGGGDR